MPPEASMIATQADSRQYNVFKNFETTDTQGERWGLPANRLAWCENLQILAPNKLQCIPGPGPALTTIAGKTIYREFFAAINGGDFVFAFATDGSAFQVALASGTVTQFAPVGTFSNPDVTSWKQSRILIADPAAGYATWDGLVFVQSGGVSPNIVITNGGSGYLAVPTVTISGGSGVGATAKATVINGTVNTIQLTNAGHGYKAGDVLTVTFGGPGVGAAATAIVFPILSFNPTTIAVAFQRVWLAGGNILQYSGTAGFDDANTANAAGFTAITDADLVHQITALRSLNNFLYIFGDASIKQIGTITVSGAATIFAITTLSSDTGTVFPRSIQSYNRVVTFANFEGVWQIFGATVTKISDEMDGIFGSNQGTNKSLVDFTFDPQAIIATLNAQRVYMLLIRYLDPLQGPRSLFLCRQGKRWYMASQGSTLTAVTTAILGGRLQPYGTSSNDITPILFDPNVPVAILLKTAMDQQNKDNLNKRVMRLGFTQFVVNSGAAINWTIDTENVSIGGSYIATFPIIWLNNLSQVVTWQNASLGTVTWVGGGFLWQEQPGSGTGIYIGVTISGTMAGFRFTSVVIEYMDSTLMRSRNK